MCSRAPISESIIRADDAHGYAHLGNIEFSKCTTLASFWNLWKFYGNLEPLPPLAIASWWKALSTEIWNPLDELSYAYITDPPKGDPSNGWPVPKRMTLRSIERGGIGYKKGYATLEMLFAPLYLKSDFIPMLDLRGHHLYNDSYAANAGLIGRYMRDSSCIIYGFNAYYDFRQGCFGNFNRLGGGLEILGRRWELHANGYFPIGKDEHRHKCVFDDFEGGFFAIFHQLQFGFWGGDAELGYYPVKSRNFLLYLGAGPYFLKGKCNFEAWGGKARLRPQFSDYLAAEFSVSYDHIFQTIYQGEIILNLPLYLFYSKKKQRKCISERRIYQPVERFEIIPLKKRRHWETNF